MQIKDDHSDEYHLFAEERQYLKHLQVLAKMHCSKVYGAAQRLEDLQECEVAVYELA